jgi:hypothetical protein
VGDDRGWLRCHKGRDRNTDMYEFIYTSAIYRDQDR